MYKKKTSIKQIWIMRPNEFVLPLVYETIFRDRNGGMSKSLKVGARGLLRTPVGSRGNAP